MREQAGTWQAACIPFHARLSRSRGCVPYIRLFSRVYGLDRAMHPSTGHLRIMFFFRFLFILPSFLIFFSLFIFSSSSKNQQRNSVRFRERILGLPVSYDVRDADRTFLDPILFLPFS